MSYRDNARTKDDHEFDAPRSWWSRQRRSTHKLILAVGGLAVTWIGGNVVALCHDNFVVANLTIGLVGVGIFTLVMFGGGLIDRSNDQ